MKLIYVIGAFTDKDTVQRGKNINRATLAGMELAEAGNAVIVPHNNFRLQNLTITYEQIMDQCAEVITRVDAVYVLNNWKTSKGSKREIKLAKKLGKEIIWEKE